MKNLFYNYLCNIGEKVIVNIQYNKLYSKNNIYVMNSLDTIKMIIERNISVSRYGDGEFLIMQGRDIFFQKHNRLLEQKLYQIQNNKKLLVCLPNIFSNRSLKSLTRNSSFFWKRNSIKNYNFLKQNFKEKTYGDSLISRFYIIRKNKNESKTICNALKKIWKGKKIVLIEGEASKLGVGNDLFDNTNVIRRILMPSVNAFDFYNECIDFVLHNVQKNELIILALGPTATVMAFDLTNYGYQALDLGHFDIEYEWMIKKVKRKTPIPNKYVAEVKGGSLIVENETDFNYFQQILKVFKR